MMDTKKVSAVGTIRVDDLEVIDGPISRDDETKLQLITTSVEPLMWLVDRALVGDSFGESTFRAEQVRRDLASLRHELYETRLLRPRLIWGYTIELAEALKSLDSDTVSVELASRLLLNSKQSMDAVYAVEVRDLVAESLDLDTLAIHVASDTDEVELRRKIADVALRWVVPPVGTAAGAGFGTAEVAAALGGSSIAVAIASAVVGLVAAFTTVTITYLRSAGDN